MGEPRELRIRLLGGLDIEGIGTPDLGSRKARGLVKVLALGRGAVVSTGAVVEALWPGDDAPARPVEQVGVLASRLRRSLGARRLVRTEAGWALFADWLDVAELEARAAEAVERLDAGQLASARTAAHAALDVMRGPLLPDDEGPWVEGERAACERLGGRVRLILAEAAWAAGDSATAAADAERALDVDPFDEVALRIAMRALAASGRPASALALYARVRQLLVEELGVDPTAETEAVHDEVLLAEAVPRAPAPSTSLVGRTAELDQLRAATRHIGQGGVWTVEVIGDAGIGKTALLDAWIAETPITVLRAQCDELGRDLPLQPVLDALVAEDAVLAAAVGRATSVVDPTAGQTALFAELVGRLNEIAGSGSVALVLDDVQYADPMTLAFCHMVRRKASRCLIVVAQRTGAGIETGADERIEVGPLTLDAVTRLVGAERAGPLLERSGGNPLFLLQLAASAGDDLPASVRDAVTSRIESLGSDVAATVRAAAVLGVEIDLDLLAAVLHAPAVELLHHLDAASASGLLDDRGSLAFSHSLVRDALVAGTTPSRRAWLHREAAVTLAGRPKADELTVARHAREGGDRVLASVSLVRAAEATAARFDVEGAEALLDDAIALDDTAAARIARARVRIARYFLEAAAVDAEVAVSLGAGAEALEVGGWVAYYQRDYDRALRYADEGAARADDDALRASCLVLGGRVRHSTGDLAGAEGVLTEALDIAPPSVRGLAQVWLSGVRSHQSRAADAIDLAERALLHPGEIGHPFAPLHGRFARATGLAYRGRMGEALMAVDEALAVIAEEGEQGARFTSIFLNTRGWLLRNLGFLAEADAANLEALEKVGATMLTGEPFHVAHLDLLDGAIARDDRADIDRWLAEASAVDDWDGSMSWRQKARLDLLRSRLALRNDDPADALELASSVQARAAAWSVPRYRLMAELVMDEAAATAGAVDHHAVAGRLRALAEVAAPEAWWRTAELAVVLADDDLGAEAERRAARLVASAAGVGLDASGPVAARLAAIRAR